MADLQFEFQARVAALQENMRTVTAFMQGLVEDMPETQARFERVQRGDLSAIAEWLKDFEEKEQLFAGLAAVIRDKYEHA